MTAHLFQTLLVGFDGTAGSDPAVMAGLELAERMGASVELVHAVPVPSPLWPGVDSARLAAINAEALSSAWKNLSVSVRGMIERSGRPARPMEELLRVLPGKPAQVLLERAEECAADLVILGAHQKRGLFDFGSTARVVLSKLRRAVWVQPGEFRPIRRILVPIDLSEDSLIALSQARALAERLGAAIETLHCFPPPEFAYSQGLTYPAPDPTYIVDQARAATRREYDKAMAEFDWGGVAHTHDFQESDPVSAILEKQGAIDLISMGTHGRTGISAAVLGNVAYGVLKAADVPVLAIRHVKRGWSE